MNKEISKSTETIEATKVTKATSATSATEAVNNADQPKKLVVIGLPSATAAKTGFGAGDNRPGYKAKSSKKTGAKYRVRQ